MLIVEMEYRDKILFVRLKGILNMKSSYKINNYLNPVLKKHKIKYLLYNVAKLNKIDQVGLDAILNSKYQMKENKGKIWVCNVLNNKDIFKGLRIPIIKCEEDIMEMI